jgi:preprotein translocase subunit YajC
MDSAFAQTTSQTAPAKPAPGAAPPANNVTFMLPWILIAVVGYFLLIAPANKERKKKEAMLGGVQRGDRVLTKGGIYGTVSDIKENIVVLKISENSKVEVDRSYIETVQKQS